MKFWIARQQDNTLYIFTNKPTLFCGRWCMNGVNQYYTKFWGNKVKCELFTEITFENSPQEVELKLSNHTSKPLTRDYFANHNWEIIIPEPDENGFILWEARWKRRMEEGSPYYSDLTVTNMMYEDRFCISGKTGEGNVEYLMAYTEKDLENILKVLDIYDFYEQESKKS